MVKEWTGVEWSISRRWVEEEAVYRVGEGEAVNRKSNEQVSGKGTEKWEGKSEQSRGGRWSNRSGS